MYTTYRVNRKPLPTPYPHMYVCVIYTMYCKPKHPLGPYPVLDVYTTGQVINPPTYLPTYVSCRIKLQAPKATRKHVHNVNPSTYACVMYTTYRIKL